MTLFFLSFFFFYIVVIRGIWGPTVCLFEKIENRNFINDKQQDIYQRVLTFESERSPSQTGIFLLFVF